MFFTRRGLVWGCFLPTRFSGFRTAARHAFHLLHLHQKENDEKGKMRAAATLVPHPCRLLGTAFGPGCQAPGGLDVSPKTPMYMRVTFLRDADAES